MPLLGWAPLGTYSGCSWISIHWLFTILELRSTKSNRVSALLLPHPPRACGQLSGSFNSLSFSWSISMSWPHDSHLKTALCILGLISEILVTMTSTLRSLSMSELPISRRGILESPGSSPTRSKASISSPLSLQISIRVLEPAERICFGCSSTSSANSGSKVCISWNGTER